MPQFMDSSGEQRESYVRHWLENNLVEETCIRIAHIRVTEEGQEGLGAFLEKRSPNWLQH